MTRSRSKTAATWLALVGGSLGLHRFYLHGPRDFIGWLYPAPALAGLYGVLRVRQFGQDDRLAWLLMPMLGFVLATAMFTAIVYGLTPDDKWNARWNPHGPEQRSGWINVIGVLLSLAIGATVLLATIAFSLQRLFELAA